MSDLWLVTASCVGMAIGTGAVLALFETWSANRSAARYREALREQEEQRRAEKRQEPA